MSESPAPFSKSQEDVSKLKQTITDAAADLGASSQKGKEQLGDLSQHIQQETTDRIYRAKGSIVALVDAGRALVGQRPLLILGLAVATGFLVAKLRSRDKSEQA